MIFIHETGPGAYELNYMWLPTWIGLNPILNQEIEAHINERFVGSSATIEDLHNEVINFLCKRFSEVKGLRDYLEAVEKVEGPEESG